MLNVFIGFDPKESVAFHTLAHSILRRASRPVSITPLVQAQLREMKMYWRPRGPTESTEFSLTRFLVPALSGFRGWSVFMDCDMLCRADLCGLESEIERQRDKTVLVCKHDYVPKGGRKFLNNIQTVYGKKNWSSVMVFNNERCRVLSPEYVNAASGLDLHQFKWTEEAAIGPLPLEWNWLVGEYDHNPEARIAHFTLGGPYFEEYRDCDYSAEWRAELESMKRAGA